MMIPSPKSLAQSLDCEIFPKIDFSLLIPYIDLSDLNRGDTTLELPGKSVRIPKIHLLMAEFFAISN